MFEFCVVTGTTAQEVIARRRDDVVQVVRDAYLAHEAGRSHNPPSYFLRPPGRPGDRVIALPACLSGASELMGMKWIASFPGNVPRGIPRASATLVLNDPETGYPYALLEASQISAARTAASAALAAEVLAGGRAAGRLLVVGAGIIARNVLEFLAARAWTVGAVTVHDTHPDYASTLAGRARELLGCPADVAPDLAAALPGADVVLLATTAASPHLVEPDTFRAGQLVLNLSLRDLGPEVVVGAYNVLDDVDHCLTAGTSPHLAEQAYGHRDFVTATLGQVLDGSRTVPHDKPVIFSPFGLGILDLAVGDLVHRDACERESAVEIAGFFAETTR